jgi:hypothetical protein
MLQIYKKYIRILISVVIIMLLIGVAAQKNLLQPL